MFKIAGVCLFILWIPQFADLIRAPALKFGSGTARQIANTHTIFNVSPGLFFLPFIPLLFDEKHIPPKMKHDEESRLLIKEIPKRDAIFPDLTLISKK
ncbi:MAG: hypothetical protein DRH26_01950 [Deltaproteobacteria bacterium]|nr:MAG: hypothetical protein DRH26_01950 [Deltaproteobacteria bacterium]